jgi:hypothetical protein
MKVSVLKMTRTLFTVVVFFLLVLIMSGVAYATTCSVAASGTVPIAVDEEITLSCSEIDVAGDSGNTVTIAPSGFSTQCLTVSPSSKQVTASSPSTTFTVTGVSTTCMRNIAGRTITWTFSHSGGNSISSKSTTYNIIRTPSITPTFSQVTYNVTNGTYQNISITLALTTGQSQVDIRNIDVTLTTTLNGSVSGVENKTDLTIDVSESTTQYATWNLQLPPLPPGVEYDFNVSVSADNANDASASTTINVTTAGGVSQADVTIGLSASGAAWNLISIPVQTDNVSIGYLTSTIAGNFEAIYAWNAQTQQYIGYDPAYPQYSALRNMTVDKGYFVKMTANDNLTLTGTLPPSTGIDLVLGWNLIGYPSATGRPVGTALSDISGNYEAVYAWNPSSQQFIGYDPIFPQYSNLQNMTYGRGYFVKATSTGTITVT